MSGKFKLKPYLAAQVREIEKYKWLASEQRGYDIGFTRAALEWIELYSSAFRKHWFGTEGEKAA